MKKKRGEKRALLLWQQIGFQARRRSRQNRPVFEDKFGRFQDPHDTLKSANQFFPCYSVLPDIARRCPLLRSCHFVAGDQSSPNFFLRRPIVMPNPHLTVVRVTFSPIPRQCSKNVARNYRSFVYLRPENARNECDFATLLSPRCHAPFRRLIVKKEFFPELPSVATCPIGFVKFGVNGRVTMAETVD